MASERPSAQGKHLRFPKLGRGNGNSLRRLRCAPQRRHGERGNDTRHGGIRRREHSALVAAVWHTYPKAGRLVICADSGGSNAARNRAWKYYLQQFSDEAGLEIVVGHYPPGDEQ